MELFPSLVGLGWKAATKIFWLGLLIPVLRCFSGGKRTAKARPPDSLDIQEVLIAHLDEVIASLFIEHGHKAKHSFSGQRYSVLRFF
jgi:hypothetical protein